MAVTAAAHSRRDTGVPLRSRNPPQLRPSPRIQLSARPPPHAEPHCGWSPHTQAPLAPTDGEVRRAPRTEDSVIPVCGARRRRRGRGGGGGRSLALRACSTTSTARAASAEAAPQAEPRAPLRTLSVWMAALRAGLVGTAAASAAADGRLRSALCRAVMAESGQALGAAPVLVPSTSAPVRGHRRRHLARACCPVCPRFISNLPYWAPDGASSCPAPSRLQQPRARRVHAPLLSPKQA